jgi:hypothetical protein
MLLLVLFLTIAVYEQFVPALLKNITNIRTCVVAVYSSALTCEDNILNKYASPRLCDVYRQAPAFDAKTVQKPGESVHEYEGRSIIEVSLHLELITIEENITPARSLPPQTGQVTLLLLLVRQFSTLLSYFLTGIHSTPSTP